LNTLDAQWHGQGGIFQGGYRSRPGRVCAELHIAAAGHFRAAICSLVHVHF
jgi:hypothetical protein